MQKIDFQRMFPFFWKYKRGAVLGLLVGVFGLVAITLFSCGFRADYSGTLCESIFFRSFEFIPLPWGVLYPPMVIVLVIASPITYLYTLYYSVFPGIAYFVWLLYFILLGIAIEFFARKILRFRS